MSFYGETRKTKGELIRAVNYDHGLALGMKDADLLQNNTLRYSLPDGRKVIRLHNTDIVQIDRKGVVTLDSGGYQTVTTKDRINSYAPGISVYANKGWHVRTAKGTFPYVDGARFKPDGTPCNLKAMQANDKRVERELALVDKFMAHARKEGWGKSDGAGDPWLISGPEVGREVMLDWIKGRYYTRAMCRAALATRFRPMGVELYFRDFAKDNGKPTRFLSGLLRRYIKAQLGLA